MVPGRWRHLPALLVSFAFVFPLIVMLSGSLRPAGSPPPVTPDLIPTTFAVSNYPEAYDLVNIPRYAVNSLFVAAVAVPLSVLVASWAGFAMSQLPGRARAMLLGLTLVTLMVPATALLVSRFALFRSLGLTNTFVPLMAPALLGMSPFYVLIYYWSFRRLPVELFETCRLEGVGPLAAWRQVAMPLVRPVTVAVAVLAFVTSWGNFLDPLIYLLDEQLYTLPLGLRALAELDPPFVPLTLAGAVTATAPVVLAFLAVQRFFLQEHRGAGWLGR